MAACTDAPWPVSDVISGHDKKYKIISSAPPKFSGSPVVSHRTTNEGSLDNGQLEHTEGGHMLWDRLSVCTSIKEGAIIKQPLHMYTTQCT